MDGRLAVAALLGCAAFFVPRPAAAAVVRGPIVQDARPDGVTLLLDTDVAVAPVVRFGPTEAYGQEAAAPSGTRHEVVLTGLEPGRVYHYAFFDGDTPLTEDATFPTALVDATPFRFILFGDTRSRPDAHATVVDAMVAEADVRFAVQTGDLVSDGGVPEQWAEYFDIERDLMRRVPVYAVIGNHDESDGRADLYTAGFALPANSPQPEHFYSFRHGNVHVTVLDGHVNILGWAECLVERSVWLPECFTAEQEDWLRADLQAAATDPSVDHILVTLHIGPYTSKDGRDGNAQIRRLLPFFQAMGVSAIISGHDHYYERGTSAFGMPYIITGGGGAPLYDVADPNKYPHTVAYNESVEHYIVVDVDGPTLAFTARTPDGRVLDAFTVTSTPECAEDLDCGGVEPPPDCVGPAVCTAAERCAFACYLEGADPNADPVLEPPPAAAAPGDAPDAGDGPAPEPDAGPTAEPPTPGASPTPGGSGDGCRASSTSPGGGLLAPLLLLALLAAVRRARTPA